MKKLLIIIMCLFLTGCSNYSELTELDIVSSILLDYKDNKYFLTLEILDTQKEAEQASYFIKSEGNNIANCFYNIYKFTHNKIYLNHMETLVITKSIAKNKLLEIIDYFTRNPEIKKDFYVVLNNDFVDITNYHSPTKISFGRKVNETINRNKKENSEYKTSSFREILNSHLNEKNYVIGDIIIKDEDIKLNDTYLISNDKLIQKIDNKAIILLNIMSEKDTKINMGSLNNFIIYKYKFNKNIKRDTINLNFVFDIRIENLKDYNIKTYKDLLNIEKKINSELEMFLNDCIKYSININKDIYNLEYYYKLLYKKPIYENLKNFKININVKSNINEKGLTVERVN